MPLWLNTPAFAEAHVFPSPFAHADAQEVTDFAEAIVTLLFRFVQRTWKPCDSSSDGFFIVNNALYTVTQVLYLSVAQMCYQRRSLMTLWCYFHWCE